MKETGYQVIHSHDAHTFGKLLAEAVLDGWECSGNVWCTYPPNGAPSFFQAMTLGNESTEGAK